jgi:GntR family transcriptional regulator
MTSLSTEYAFSVAKLGELDATSFVPLYMQLADRIATLIREHGEHGVGKILPSEAECVQHLQVSRPTVRQAMSRLLAQGLILREKGRGTFIAPLKLEHDVSHGFEDDMRAAHRQVGYTLLAWDRVEAPQDVAAIFGSDTCDEFFLLRRLRSVEGKIVGIEERYLPGAIALEVKRSEIASAPVVDLVQRVTKQKVGRLDMEVSSMAADTELASLLTVSEGAPLLLRRSTFISESAQPLMHGTVTFVAEHYKFKLRINYSSRVHGSAD